MVEIKAKRKRKERKKGGQKKGINKIQKGWHMKFGKKDGKRKDKKRGKSS